MKDKIIPVVAIIALVLAVISFIPRTGKLAPIVDTATFGAAGAITGMLAENYDPYVRYNQGYNSELDIKTTGDTTLASTTATTLKVGQVGSAVTRIVRGTCNMQSNANTIAATTTVQIDCQAGAGGTQSALTNVPAWASGDTVFFGLASSTATSFGGLNVIGASASTTAGYITLQLYNQTGGTFTWTRLASTSHQYLFIR